jgi:hypothetical protein
MAERKSFLLRIDASLWSEVERLAAEELRSANGQVEYLLREALRRRGRAAGTATGDSAVAGAGVSGEPPLAPAKERA